SINDTIVVFDRVRENFRGMRAPPMEVLNASINQTLSRTVITSVVAFLTVLAQYLYGGGSLEGMSLSMMIGIVIGTASSILVACPLLTIGVLKVTTQHQVPKAPDDAERALRPRCRPRAGAPTSSSSASAGLFLGRAAGEEGTGRRGSAVACGVRRGGRGDGPPESSPAAPSSGRRPCWPALAVPRSPPPAPGGGAGGTPVGPV